MPSKNSVKTYISSSYYHIYNRGVRKSNIFLQDADFKYFTNLMKRYLLPADQIQNRPPYPNFHNCIELQAYCLMNNHFHLLIFQENERDIEKFMRSLMTAYGIYYNKRYKSSGYVFQGNYRAVLIDSDPYLLHISRYIHRNPKQFETYMHSSYQSFTHKNSNGWLRPDRLLKVLENIDYLQFVDDFAGLK